MGLVPPWTVTGGPGSSYPGIVFSLGYHPIFFAPFMGSVDIVRLLLQWILVAIVASAVAYFWSSLIVAYQKIITKRMK